MNVCPEPDAFGPLRIWKPSEPGVAYVIGVDVAEGKSSDGTTKGGDYSCCFVIDSRTMEHVATWHGRIDPWEFAEECAALGYYYNQALLAIERNNHGLTVLKRLDNELQYPSLYQQKYNPDKSSGRQKPVWKLGLYTDTKMKPIVVDALRAAIRRVTPIRDHRFYTEGLTWVLDEKGKPQTNEGAHDDVLMAAGIAFYVAHEAYGGSFLTKRPIRIRPKDAEAHARNETWRKIIARTQEVQVGEDPWNEVPDEVAQFY